MTRDAAAEGETAMAARRPAVFDLAEQESIAIPQQALLQNGVFDIYPEVEGKDLFAIRADGRNLVLQARGFVGLIPVNGSVSINVRPRVPIKNLQRLLDISAELPLRLARHVSKYAPQDQILGSWADALSDAFLETMGHVRSRGLYRTYRRREHRSLHPRGRILLGKTFRLRSRPTLVPDVVTSAFERTIDNEPNRCLKTALWTLGKLYSAQRTSRRRHRIGATLNWMPAVAVDRSYGFLKHRVVRDPSVLSDWHSQYVDALNLAKAIIRGSGVDLLSSSGVLRLDAMVLNMANVFERYIRNVLTAALEARGQFVRDGNKDPWARSLLSSPAGQGVGRATPDIVVLRGDQPTSTARVVMDCKYKPFTGHPPREDLNQVITYAKVYGVDRVVIVHPAETTDRSGPALIGWLNTLAVFRYGFLLGDDISREEAALARWCEKLCTAESKADLEAISD